MVPVLGLAPYLSPSRPRSAPRWWVAHGLLEPAALVVERLEEHETQPLVASPCGLAAPLSLPQAFLDFLGIPKSIDIDGRTDRILRRAREFAGAASRGKRQPLRVPHESMPALDRRRLPLFLAALPLLRGEARALVFEVDTPAVLRKLGLPHAGLSGARPGAIDRRSRVLAALTDGALGFPVLVRARDYGVASLPALSALVACAMAARLRRDDARRPDGAETWVPLP